MQTFDDATSLKSALEDLELSLAGSTPPISEIIKKGLSAPQQRFVEEYLSKGKVDMESKEAVTAAIKTLLADLDKVKPVDLLLAVEPDEDMKNSVVEWLSKNLKTAVLPRYSVNKAFLGGAKLTYNGIYLDLSLRRKIDELSILKAKL